MLISPGLRHHDAADVPDIIEAAVRLVVFITFAVHIALIPEREDMGWESGWAFYSGDEGDVYGEGDEYYESHCGFYDIRDICRIDPDIIRFLNLPYGTMKMCGEDGAWYEVIRDDDSEEET